MSSCWWCAASRVRVPTVWILSSMATELGWGFSAVSSLASLTFLKLTWCCNVTDEGLRAVVIK
jgi:hypothetical protein